MKIQFFRYKFNFEKYWTEKYWNRKKVMINTNTTISKSIENNQYKYFLKVLKIQIVLMVKGLKIIYYNCSDMNAAPCIKNGKQMF